VKKIVLISDTHNVLDKHFFKYFSNADEIWHAGDIGNLTITDKLKEFAILKAVYGNIDNSIIRSEFSNTLYFKCEDINVLMTHIGGYPGNYNKNILPIIKEKKIDLFICGHSHILKVIYDKKYNLLHLNPGAMGNFGIHQVKTLIKFDIEKKNIKNLKIIEIPKKH
tara:strand:- start:11540 stop:12037 length:498 start_codon:yes stop_codon:yes gene_type:complete